MSEKPTYEWLEQRVLELEKSDLKRKKAEDALRESEERFRRFFMNAPLPYQSLDENGDFIEVNSTFLEILGYSQDEVIGKNFGDFLHPDDIAHFKETFPRFKAAGEVLGVEFEMIKKDGSTILVSFNGKIQRDDQSRFLCTHCIFQDITERKRAEDALRESEERYRSLYDSSLDAILLTAPDGRILAVNPSTSRLFERTEEEIKQIGRSGLLDTSDPRLALALEERNRRGKFHGELTFIRKSGARFPGEISSSVFKDKDGNLRTSMMIRDITCRKHAEAEKAQLEEQRRQLQKAESLSRMAGAIAHNFNNQLQVVTGNLEMAMRDQFLGSETLEEALKAARKAAEVSALMLTYSGKQPSKHEPIDLSAACRQSLALLDAAAPMGTKLKADLPASGPVILCNSGQIQQVIINLVTNAWESADENRRGIGLTVKTVSQKDIPAFKRFPAGWDPQESVYACLEVADAGCGIACKDIENIFDPFFTTKFTGRGLGLSAVLGIVTAHNGGITLESQPNRGSIFSVFFPLSAEKDTRQPDKQTLSSEIQDGATVLLIEDQEQVRKMAGIMLAKLGYRVIEAKDGIEALEIFKQHQDEIRCVLSDLTMPGMNGWETLAALRKLSPDIPVILSSGYDEAQVMSEEHQERPNAFLGKPYRLQDLKDTIGFIL